MPENEPNSNQPPANRSFATTRWSLVRAAHSCASADSSEALESLCKSYWYPLYVYIRRKGYQAAESQDITQSFIAEILERESIKRANPELGRFRAFLLGALNRFLAEWYRQSQAKKRGGGQKVLSINWTSAEERYSMEPADTLTPERVFDRRWALTVLETTRNQLQETYVAEGKQALFEALECYITAADNHVPYSVIADSLGMKEGAIKVAVHRLRRRYRDRLRAEIAHTVESNDELESELSHLFQALRH